MHTRAQRLRGRDVLKQAPEDGLALSMHLTFWALGPRALVMAVRVPDSALHTDSRLQGQVTPSPGLSRSLDLHHDFLVNNQDTCPSKGF